MRNGKKIFGYLVLAAIAVLACLELSHWGDRQLEPVSENAAANLRREPAAAITEEERTAMEAVFQCAAVKELLESGKSGDLPAAEDPSLRAAAENCLDPETAGLSIVSVISYPEGSALVLNWSGDRNRTTLQRMGSGDEAEYFKCFARDSFPGVTTVYENWDNEKVRRSRAHHWWFSWLTAEW